MSPEPQVQVTEIARRLAEELATLSATIAPPGFFAALLARAVNWSQAVGGAVWLGPGSDMKLAAEVNLRSSHFHDHLPQRLGMAQALRWVRQNGRPLIITPMAADDPLSSAALSAAADDDPDCHQPTREPSAVIWNHTTMAFFHVPLRAAGQVVGVMQLWHQPNLDPRHYRRFMQLLTAMATPGEIYLEARAAAGSTLTAPYMAGPSPRENARRADATVLPTRDVARAEPRAAADPGAAAPGLETVSEPSPAGGVTTAAEGATGCDDAVSRGGTNWPSRRTVALIAAILTFAALLVVAFSSDKPTGTVFPVTPQQAAPQFVTSIESGTVTELLVRTGETVQGGQPLLRLDNPQLAEALESARREVERWRTDARQFRAAGHPDEAQLAETRADNAARQVAEFERRRQLLTVRAPAAGRITFSAGIQLRAAVMAGTRIAKLTETAPNQTAAPRQSTINP